MHQIKIFQYSVGIFFRNQYGTNKEGAIDETD
jgi:hypothetical protein